MARSHLIPLVALLWYTKQSRADKCPFKTVPVSVPVWVVCLRGEDEKDVVGKAGFWCGFFDAVGLFYFPFTLALWRNGEADISAMGGFSPMQSGQEGLCHRRAPTCSELGKLDSQGEEGFLWPDFWLIASNIVHLLRWCCSSASGSQNLDTHPCCQGTVAAVVGRHCQAGADSAGSSRSGHVTSVPAIKPLS